jgi:hypothetical protein
MSHVRRTDHEQRRARLAKHAFRNRAQPPALEAMAAVRAHHDKIGRCRRGDNRLGRRAPIDGRGEGDRRVLPTKSR